MTKKKTKLTEEEVARNLLISNRKVDRKKRIQALTKIIIICYESGYSAGEEVGREVGYNEGYECAQYVAQGY